MNQLNTYDSILAAKYLRACADNLDYNLNVTKVQKILFVIYGFYRATKEHSIFDERPKAWPYGPVFPKTRKPFIYDKKYNTTDSDFSEIKNDIVLNKVFVSALNTFGKYTAKQLSDWSHSSGSPWEKATKEPDFKWGNPIPDEYIGDYFRGFMKMDVANNLFID